MKMIGTKSLSAKLKLLLDITWYFSLVACAVGAIALVVLSMNKCPMVGVLEAGGTSQTCWVSVDGIHFKMDEAATQLQSTEGGKAFFTEGVGKLTVNGAVNTSTGVVTVLGLLVIAALYLSAIWQLRKLFKTFADGTPFMTSNVSRLRAIAASLLGLAIFSSLFSAIMTLLLERQFHGTSVHLVARGDTSLTTIFGAIVIFILAEIFRLGAELEDEKAQTV